MVNVGDVKVDVSKMAITKGREAPQDSHSLHRWNPRKRLSLRHCSSPTTLVASDAYRGWGILTVRIRYHSLRELLSSKHSTRDIDSGRVSQARHRNFRPARLFTPQQLLVRPVKYSNIRYRHIFFAIHRIGEFLPCLSIQIRTAATTVHWPSPWIASSISWKSTEFQKETESYRGIFLKIKNHINNHVWNPGACGEWQCARSCQT
jgi:hypothetical protein